MTSSAHSADESSTEMSAETEFEFEVELLAVVVLLMMPALVAGPYKRRHAVSPDSTNSRP